jgi:hypothetical protein
LGIVEGRYGKLKSKAFTFEFRANVGHLFVYSLFFKFSHSTLKHKALGDIVKAVRWWAWDIHHDREILEMEDVGRSSLVKWQMWYITWLLTISDVGDENGQPSHRHVD